MNRVRSRLAWRRPNHERRFTLATAALASPPDQRARARAGGQDAGDGAPGGSKKGKGVVTIRYLLPR
jgi:hypothetical protein